MTSDDRPILCLDFDGVLHAYTSGYQGDGKVPDGPVPGAMQFVIDATPEFRIAVYSTRSQTREGRTAMQTALRYWLCEAGADWAVFDQLEFPECKPPALVTIDDRAIQFTGTFPEVKKLLAFQPWNQRPPTHPKGQSPTKEPWPWGAPQTRFDPFDPSDLWEKPRNKGSAR